MLSYNKDLKSFSQQLRKNLTDAERRLWARIRGKQLKGYQFYRQKIIGDYIVDFYCPKAKLVIELDGGQHYTEEGRQKDERRGESLASRGLQVLRFSDRDVMTQIDSVLEKIWSCLDSENLP